MGALTDFIKAALQDEKDFVYNASNGKSYKIYKDNRYGDYSIDDAFYEYIGCSPLFPIRYRSRRECIEAIEEQLKPIEELKKVKNLRIAELKKAFEESGRKQNFAEPAEVDTLISLTEKKIIQQCRRPQCHGCKLGWICPKFWA